MDLESLFPRPLIVGVAGQVGTAMAKLLPGAVTLRRSQLDLSKLEDPSPILEKAKPTALINCAAWTAVDAAEDNEEPATIVNARAVEVMAVFCATSRIPFLTFSTDYVFDGKAVEPYVESASRGPLNAYGRSKALGEDLVLAADPKALVVRSSWVISDTHPSFLSVILGRLAHGPVRVVADQWGAPTAAGDLAAGSLAALAGGTSGVLHLTNTGATTWHGLATEVARVAGYASALVNPCASDEYPTRAVRPRYSVLGSERLVGEGLTPLPPWQDSVARLVPNLLKSVSN